MQAPSTRSNKLLVLAGAVLFAGMFHTESYGWGITMVVAAAVFAVSGGLINSPGLSQIAGFAMIGGFFCPWIDPGHITGYELARANGWNPVAIAAWLVPIGGSIAAYGSKPGPRGRLLGAAGGLIGLAAIGYLTFRL